MPPILGGKSLVTSRCFTPDLARACRVDRASAGAGAASSSATSGSSAPTRASSRSSRPSRRQAQTAWARSIGSRSAEVPRQRGRPRPGPRGRPRCRARPARCGAATRVAAGEVPAPVASQQRGVVGLEELEQRHPGLDSTRIAGRLLLRRASPCPGRVRSLVGRADLLAVVAAVDAVAERLPMGPRERARAPAPARPGSGRRRSRPGATMAPVGQPSRQRRHAPHRRRPAPRWPAAARSSRRSPARTTNRLRDAAGWRSCRTSRARRDARPPGRPGRCRRPAPAPGTRSA